MEKFIFLLGLVDMMNLINLGFILLLVILVWSPIQKFRSSDFYESSYIEKKT